MHPPTRIGFRTHLYPTLTSLAAHSCTIRYSLTRSLNTIEKCLIRWVRFRISSRGSTDYRHPQASDAPGGRRRTRKPRSATVGCAYERREHLGASSGCDPSGHRGRPAPSSPVCGRVTIRSQSSGLMGRLGFTGAPWRVRRRASVRSSRGCGGSRQGGSGRVRPCLGPRRRPRGGQGRGRRCGRRGARSGRRR